MTKKTETQLAADVEQLTAERTAAEAKLAGLRREHADEMADLALGYADAKLRAEPIGREIAEWEKEQRRIVGALDQARSALDAAQRARAEAEELERARQVPAAAAHHMALARATWDLAVRLGDALRQLDASRERLAEAIGTKEGKRLFRDGAHRDRILQSFVRVFDLPPPPRSPGGAPVNHYEPVNALGLRLSGLSPWSKMTFPQAEQEAVDACVRTYTNKADALAARDRIDPETGTLNLHAVQETATGLWRLAEGRRRGAGAPSVPAAPIAAAPDPTALIFETQERARQAADRISSDGDREFYVVVPVEPGARSLPEGREYAGRWRIVDTRQRQPARPPVSPSDTPLDAA